MKFYYFFVILLNFVKSEDKPRCYFDQKRIGKAKRIELWREFKYPIQCQEKG